MEVDETLFKSDLKKILSSSIKACAFENERMVLYNPVPGVVSDSKLRFNLRLLQDFSWELDYGFKRKCQESQKLRVFCNLFTKTLERWIVLKVLVPRNRGNIWLPPIKMLCWKKLENLHDWKGARITTAVNIDNSFSLRLVFIMCHSSYSFKYSAKRNYNSE